ncbi:ATP-dependent DNA helicase RecG [Acinetobacter qingfengensis]|uniref:ATP-dependent DNA helicase RecG n=1 Tax=Acinetobacter qingfengensis TaxID=1262585 RepID=A0A1E7R2X9_9GAMM|nr:ATP-dependent DNA helicase RecG [Acinetobacter qingfengensis]KAA8733844.1 ATP-dependent DNA helicase RecG [Acinetobacter qingfengensis]OEY93643.1 ATP-dependent DNA helicase RecG [Acinetobacter qingfengensis]
MAIPIRQITGVTATVAQQLEKLNLFNSHDLLFHLPRDYEDRSTIIDMQGLQVGRTVLLQGEVKSVDFPPGKRKSMAVLLQDASGKITLRFYHIYKALTEQLSVGKQVRVFGEVRLGARGMEMYHPEITPVTDHHPLPKSELTPIYPTTDGLKQSKLRQIIDLCLKQHSDDLFEYMPEGIAKHYALKDALKFIHHPPLNSHIQQLREARHPAQQRLIFEELVTHQISLLQRRLYIQQIQAVPIKPSQTFLAHLLQQLPFSPTQAQQRVTQEILQDLQKNKPMLRLVQGDVGAGKTLVAAMAATHVLEDGWQVAIMAPTEILAEQHFINFAKWFVPLGLDVVFLASKLRTREKNKALEQIATGSAQVVIGTHALFQDQVKFQRLGLVIIDEQHRFGVDQRLALRDKGHHGHTPHQLVMTATPIPRTLAMSAYGDLDTSIIDELPPGRTPIQTVAMPLDKREQVLQRIYDNCMQGKQAYWVCTLVEQSETLDAQAAEAIYAEIKQKFPDLKLGLAHGKLKAEEKQAVMQEFKQNKLQLLIATTVIEVGVDVPNASIMVIENAERLGLSQLHQLRGRVGRGSQQSFCVLLYKSPLSHNGQARLDILRQTNDGFVIAERDLELRGPGDVLGTKQTGELSFKVANLQRDDYLLEKAHQVAQRILQQHPDKAEALMQRWLPEAPRYAFV